MKTTDFINSYTENAEYDDEAGMVKNNLHTIIRVSTHLERAIGDNENMPEWCQEKIAQVKGMIVSVMDYMISQHEMGKQDEIPGFNPAAADVQMSEMLSAGSDRPNPVTSAITRRIMMQRIDLLQKYGPELVGNAIDEVADYVGDWIGPDDEIGTSDVSGWVKHVERMLANNPPEAFGEAEEPKQKKPAAQPTKRQQEKQQRQQQSRDAFKGFFGGDAADLTKNLKIREDATGGATMSSVVGTVVTELGEQGMSKKELNKKIGGYTNITTRGKAVKVKGAY
jgi:hypothetical protein